MRRRHGRPPHLARRRLRRPPLARLGVRVSLRAAWGFARSTGGRVASRTDGILPQRSAEHFNRAIRFLGALFVAYHEQIAEQGPELRADIQRALRTELWRTALRDAPELWARRLVRGEVDPTEQPADIVFWGTNLVVLSVGTGRYTFKLPTDGIDRSEAAHIAGWWTTPAGTRAATILRIGSRRWHFDSLASSCSASSGADRQHPRWKRTAPRPPVCRELRPRQGG